MAGNILQGAITPVKPKVLEKENIFVYVEEASTSVKGIASYNADDFAVSAGRVRIKWPYAHEGKFGLVKIAPDSAGYLRFTDDGNNYLEVDAEKLDLNISSFIEEHNNSLEAHPDIRVLISEINETLNNKVDIVSGKFIVRNTETGITLRYSPNQNTGSGETDVIGTVDSNYITIDDKKIYMWVEHGPTGQTSGMALRLTTGETRPMLQLWNLSDEGLLDDYPREGSGLATLYDTTKLVPINHEAFVSGEGNLKSNITNEGIITLTSNKNDITNTLKLTPEKFTLNDKNIALEEYVDTRVSEVNAVNIRNKEPNLIIEATSDTVQTVATQYIVDNYGREPEANDGLFITMTDSDNDVIKYAYFNGSWVNVGINKVDLSNYVPKAAGSYGQGNGYHISNTVDGIILDDSIPYPEGYPPTATGIFKRKAIELNSLGITIENITTGSVNEGSSLQFPSYGRPILQVIDEREAGTFPREGSGLATLHDLHQDVGRVLILGADGTIGEKANLVIKDAESFKPYVTNNTEVLMSVIIPVTGEIDLTKEVIIDFDNTSYYLFDAIDTSKHLTLGDLSFALKESLVTGYNYLFKAIFFNNSDNVGFAVLPDKNEVLSLDSDQMDYYIAEGGLPNGQIVICNRVITNGYTEGGIYRFKITYPDTYEFEELLAGGGIETLVGTDEKPLNLATDLEVSKLYILSGKLYYNSNSKSTFEVPTLVYKISNSNLVVYNVRWAGINNIQNYSGMYTELSINASSGDIGIKKQYFSVASFNGTSTPTGAISFYAPTSSGSSGQILQSNGTSKAPTWIDMPDTVQVDNETITKNDSEQIQAVALKDKVLVNVDNALTKTNFNGIIELTNEEAEELEKNGTVILTNGETITYDPGTIYVTGGYTLLQTLTLNQNGSVVTSQEVFNSHVHVMIEFETDGMHYGTDFVLHPHDSAICLVSYNFVGHTGTAYLDENGYININVPDGLTFTNIKGHAMDLGG